MLPAGTVARETFAPSIHVPLREVARHVTQTAVLRTLRVLHQGLARDLGLAPAVVDVLGWANGARQRWESVRIATHNGHGTGCTLSSAIAVYLAKGHTLPEAVGRARAYILGAITAGARVHTGHGQGPLNHGFAPLPMAVMSA